MAADLNRVILVGRLTRDVELRQTAGGTPVARIRLAVGSRVKQRDEWVDKPNYFDVTVFGRQAESAGKWLAKGLRCAVDGRLSWREWEANDGSRRQAVEVIADTLQYLDFRDQDGARGAPSNDLPVDTPATAPALTDDDIPF